MLIDPTTYQTKPSPAPEPVPEPVPVPVPAPSPSYVVVVWNASEGLRLYGPFENQSLAHSWANKLDLNKEWHIVPVLSPHTKKAEQK